MEKKTHWKKLYNYDYLGAYSFDEGKDKILTIKEVRKETVTGENGRKDTLPVLYWLENEKPMVLNKTNSNTITNVVGSPYVEDWTRQKIQLYVDTQIKFKGGIVEGIRVRPYRPRENNEKTKLTTAIRSLLKNYKGDDKEQIKADLNELRQSDGLTVEVLKQFINTLSK